MRSSFRCAAAVLILLSIVTGIFFSVEFGERFVVSAGADGHTTNVVDNGDGTQTVYSVSGSGVRTEIITFDFNFHKDYFVMTGRHVKSDSTIHYYTNGYNFTLEPTQGTPTRMPERKKAYVRRYVGKDWQEDKTETEGGQTWYRTYYFLPWNTVTENGITYTGLNDIAESLARATYGDEGYEERLASDDGITLYMNNVFQIMRRTPVSDTVIPGQGRMETLSDMKRAQPWSQKTMELLGAYYDIPLKIQKVYFATYKVHTNCVDCALGWISSGFTSMKRFSDFCGRHKKDSGIWCEKTLQGGEDGAPGYTRANGTVTQTQRHYYTIADDDSGTQAGVKWYFAGTLNDCAQDSYGTVTDCGAKLVYLDSKGISGSPIDYGDYGSGSVFQLYSKADKSDPENASKRNLGIRLEGSGLRNLDRAVILPYKRDKEDYNVTVKYLNMEKQENTYVGRSVVKVVGGLPVSKGEEFSYSCDEVIESDDGSYYSVIDDAGVRSVYAYGSTKYASAVKGIDSIAVNRELNGKSCTFTTSGVHEQEKDAVLYIPVEEYSPGENPGESTTTRTVSITYFSPDLTASLESAIFDADAAIPSTEVLNAVVEASPWLLSCSLITTSGSRVYNIMVKQPYVLQYRGDDGKEEVTQSGLLISTVSVEREFSYTEIASLEYYRLRQAEIINGALPGERVLLEMTEDIPVCEYAHYTGGGEHVMDPANLVREIVLPTIIQVSQDTTLPPLPVLDSRYAAVIADSRIGELRVRNDRLTFGGEFVLSDSWSQKEAPSIVASAVKKPRAVRLEQNDLAIPALRENRSYKSSGSAVYTKMTGYAGSHSDTVTFTLNANSVNVHTPVYCEGIVSCDNSKYVQSMSDGLAPLQLVIGRAEGYGSLGHENDSCDFVVRVSNEGYHTDARGYGERDYSLNRSGAEGGSYIARENGKLMNQVSFSFDVFIDTGNDMNEENDLLLPSNTWHTLGTVQQRFYIPMWVEERTHTADFRTVAVNAAMGMSDTQQHANSSEACYVAADSKAAQVYGKIYGFTLTDVNSDVEWKDVFRLGPTLKHNYPLRYEDGTLGGDYHPSKRYCFTAGDRNELGLTTGRQRTFSIPLIAGSNPKYRNLGTLKAGYTWRFKLETTGSRMSYDSSFISITPSFWWISSDGKDREQVNLYYTERINGQKKALVRVGGTVDALNVKHAVTGSPELAIPDSELIDTAAIRDVTMPSLMSQRGGMYTYGGIVSGNQFKTFSNGSYAALMLERQMVAGVRGYTRSDLLKLKQTYYFEYSLPPDFHALPKSIDLATCVRAAGGIDYKEDFWKKDGYIVVSFDIAAHDHTGARYLSYGATAADNVPGSSGEGGITSGCSMWLMEGFSRGRTDYYGNRFVFEPGDVFMVYADKSILDDYEPDFLY